MIRKYLLTLSLAAISCIATDALEEFLIVEESQVEKESSETDAALDKKSTAAIYKISPADVS